MFRSVPVVHEVLRGPRSGALPASFRRDTVTLGWEDRLKTRGRRRTDAGVEFATALPRGTVLRSGDCLPIEPLQLAVAVVERPEPVLVVRPTTAREWALFGYQIGNSHQPVMLDDDAIVCAELPGMEQVLAYHGIPFLRESRPFTPVGPSASHLHQLVP